MEVKRSSTPPRVISCCAGSYHNVTIDPIQPFPEAMKIEAGLIIERALPATAGTYVINCRVVLLN